MTRSLLHALTCITLISACDDETSPGARLDAGDPTGDGAGFGDGDGGRSGDGGADGDAGRSGDGVGDGDGDSDAGRDSGTGDGDSSDAGPSTAGAHCSPGTFTGDGKLAGSGPNRADRCDDQGFEDALQAGIYEAADVADISLWNIPLAVPMTQGEPYALSIEINYTGREQTQVFELWGTSGTCGASGSATKLYSKVSPMGRYIHCLELTPEANYTDLVMLVHYMNESGGSPAITGLRSASFCATGSCQ